MPVVEKIDIDELCSSLDCHSNVVNLSVRSGGLTPTARVQLNDRGTRLRIVILSTEVQVERISEIELLVGRTGCRPDR